MKYQNKNIKKKLISIVIPAYNEEANLDELVRRLETVEKFLPKYNFENILIDNCSHDETQRFGLELAKKNNWKYIRFSRNFGFEASLSAGVHHASGDALIYLVSDLQDPPEKIKNILSIWEKNNCDIVYGVLNKRNDGSILKSIGAKIAYKLIHSLSDISIPKNATDFRLISKRVIEVLKQFPERGLYMRGLIHWVGFESKSFSYDRSERKVGKSDANVLYCVDFALKAMIAFSSKPLRLASYLGVSVMAFSGLLAFLQVSAFITNKLNLVNFESPPPGLMTILILQLFFGGLTVFVVGLCGDYIAQIHSETKSRPNYIISKKHGFSQASTAIQTAVNSETIKNVL